MTYTVDPKLVPWFIVGIVVWMAFVVCVGYFGSRGRHDGEKFVSAAGDATTARSSSRADAT